MRATGPTCWTRIGTLLRHRRASSELRRYGRSDLRAGRMPLVQRGGVATLREVSVPPRRCLSTLGEKTSGRRPPYALAGPGGRDTLRRQVDPALRTWSRNSNRGIFLDDETTVCRIDVVRGTRSAASTTWLRIDDDGGHLAGTAILMKPPPGCRNSRRRPRPPTSVTSNHALGATTRPSTGRDPMADLEASTPLARRLSTAEYFAFGRRSRALP